MAAGYATTLRNNQLDEITSFIGNAAKLRIYDGTRPATGAAITTQTLLAELVMGTPFAPAASGGVLTANAITDDSAADNNGSATWARIVKSDGTTFCMDVAAGTSGAELILNTTNIVAGAPVQVSSLTITRGNA